MGYGSYHPLPPAPPKEKYAFGLSLGELIWVFIGLACSYHLVKIVPPIPFVTNFLLVKIHAFIPLMICSVLAFGKHPKTGLSINAEIFNAIQFKTRNRILVYRRGIH